MMNTVVGVNGDHSFCAILHPGGTYFTACKHLVMTPGDKRVRCSLGGGVLRVYMFSCSAGCTVAFDCQRNWIEDVFHPRKCTRIDPIDRTTERETWSKTIPDQEPREGV